MLVTSQSLLFLSSGNSSSVFKSHQPPSSCWSRPFFFRSSSWPWFLVKKKRHLDCLALFSPIPFSLTWTMDTNLFTTNNPGIKWGALLLMACTLRGDMDVEADMPGELRVAHQPSWANCLLSSRPWRWRTVLARWCVISHANRTTSEMMESRSWEPWSKSRRQGRWRRRIWGSISMLESLEEKPRPLTQDVPFALTLILPVLHLQ